MLHLGLMNHKTIGIIGGMGPEATVDAFHWIIKLTPAKDDQDHLRVLIDNNPQIPSRIDAVLKNGPSPLPLLISTAQGLQAAGADFLIMPCNTADLYTEIIRKSIKIELISIVEETVNYVADSFPTIKKVGILATEATLRAGIYQKLFLKKHIELIHHSDHHSIINEIIPKIRSKYFSLISVEGNNEKMPRIITGNVKQKENGQLSRFGVVVPSLKFLRDKVMRAIFGSRGIKAGFYSEPHHLLTLAAHQLEKAGAEVIIMACTEIPLVLKQSKEHVPLINPIEIVTHVAVNKSLETTVE